MFQFTTKIFILLLVFLANLGNFFIFAQTTKIQNKNFSEDTLYKENFKLLNQELDTQLNTSSVESSETLNSISWGWRLLRTTFVLFFLLGGFWIFWKLRSSKKEPSFVKTSLFHVLHEFMISPGVFLKIIDFNSSLMIMSVSNAGVQLLQEIKDKQSIDQIRLDCSVHEQKQASNKGTKGETSVNTLDFWSSVVSRLNSKVYSLFPNQDIAKKQLSHENSLENSEQNLQNLRKSAMKNVSRMRDSRNNLRKGGE